MKLFRKLCRKVRICLADNQQYIHLLRRDGVTIGEDCWIDKTAEFGSEPYLISLGSHVRVTQGVRFLTHDGGIWVPRYMGLLDERSDRIGTIVIGDNTNIGWNAMILPGVAIGENCIIACGAIVTHDVPDNCVAAGVPARPIETIEEYAEKNRPRCVLTKGMSSEEKKQFLLREVRSSDCQGNQLL